MKATFSAKIEHLREMLSWICSGLESAKFDVKTLHKIELASEEALVNVIEHAYRDSPKTIELHLKIFSGHVEILIKDKGPPFNPLEAPARTYEEMPIEERPLGGLGIHLMRTCMDEVRYVREGDANLLSLIKKTSRPTPSN